jgi:hypothetical protein
MQKQEAITIIENTFSGAFNEANFTLFVKNFLNDLDSTKYNEFHGSYIKDAFRNHIRKYKRIGKYTDPNGDAMDVLIVEVADQYHLDHARTSLRNFVISHLDSFEKDYALVAFYSNSDGGADWRFSFVKLEYKTEVKEGKIKQNKELTPAKRYSFLVGEHERAHTAKKQLLPLLENIFNNPTIEELEKAFSIEAVTEEFFEQYKTLFGNLTDQFELNLMLKEELAAAGIEIPRFAKKLLGQIVFLYFLQKKGWMGVAKENKWGTGEKRFLQKSYSDAIETGKNFFGDYLQFLFYEALAHKHNDEGVQGYFAKLNCKIPFLNGGLFEADYDWENDHITIPNELFRNEEKIGKNGDIGSGVLDVFDRYNFTIKEDEPLEKEVAVDPEMLGKVFENMLEVKERKSKGAFYTPREIVHYMCQESLIHYLDNAVNTYSKTYQELGNSQIKMFGNEVKKDQQSIMFEKESIRISKEDIETFIRKGFFSLENDQRVLRVGKETTTYSFKLPEPVRKYADLLDEKLAEIRICDPAIGSGAFPVGMLHEIVNARLVLKPHLKNQDNHTNQINQSSDNYSYQLKRHTIQECIYGVDIDASAIDIARLRLWLSLVVDEEDLDTIEALPNLDYKIVCGNSLIGLPETAMRDLAVEKELEGLKDDFFKETDEDLKKELRTEINSKIRQLLDSAEQFAGYKIDFDFKLFFSEVWHDKGGFDVVIGNPPYVDIKQLPTSFVRYLFNEYITTQNRINLYSIFIEKGLRLSNKNGTLIFINPNSMLLNSSYKKLRQIIIEGLLLVVKLPDNVFKEAIVETIIIQIGKQKGSDLVYGGYYKNNEVINFDSLNLTCFKRNLWENDPDLRISIFTTPAQLRILEKINSNKIKLNDSFEFCLGITPYDKYKGHTPEQIENRIFHSKSKIDELYVPLISGSNINRFYVEENIIEEYLKYGDWLGAPRQKKFFVNPRVIVRQIVSGNPLRIFAGSTDKELYHTQIGFSIIAKKDSPFSIKVLCAYLNSSVLNFFHKYKFLDIEKNTFQKILIENCKIFPIPIVNESNIRIIEILFDYLKLSGSLKTLKLIFSFFDDLNDSVFFELFFPSEIKGVKKEILKHLGDLKPISDNMSEEQKLAIIQSEFERLYDPNHPVRNNVETLDSVEEVRIIREALK